MALPNNFILISLLFTLLFFIGLISFLTDHQSNNCEMTYMFEYPQFVKIAMPNGEKYPRYGLYAYSEGKLTERVRAMKFDGVPVLFIPGNAGSYKQGRSLASIALRKALNSRSKYHFDFFMTDFNDELSGLNGAVLEDQTSFLNESINRILTLYQPNKITNPKSVILIGHSMGGVIAQGLLVSSNITNVQLLITLGSPHRRPQINIDWYIAKYYERFKQKSTSTNNLTLITIAGGSNDRLVNSWLTNAPSSTINAVATAIPNVWLSMDHACIVWCKQLVLAIIRALFDSLDTQTRQLTSDHNLRYAAFRHHLLSNSGTNHQLAWKYRVAVALEAKGEWREDLRRQYTITVPKSKNQINYYMVRLFNDPKHQALYVQTVNLLSTDWIYICAANTIQGQSRICKEATHLSHKSEIAPSLNFKRKVFYMDLFKLKKRYPEYTHVIIRVLPAPEPVTINIDIHSPNDRLVTANLPNWYSLSKKPIIERTVPESLRYIIEVPGLQHLLQHYLLYIEPTSCKKPSHHATAKLHLPWAHQDSHIYITEGLKKPLPLRLYNSRPAERNNSTAKVILTLDPSCEYTISIRSSWIGMLQQLTRYYYPMLIANISAVVLITLYSQMMHLSREGHCLNFQSALKMNTKPYYLITFAKLISRALCFGRLAEIFPTPDGYIILNENMDFLLLPLILYVTAIGITYLLSIGLWAALIFSESTFHKFVVKGFTRAIGGALKISDWILSAVHKVPCVVAITLFSLGLSSTGALALVLGTVYYFLKITQLCQEYIEGLVFRFLKRTTFKIIGFFKRQKSSNKDSITEKSNSMQIEYDVDSKSALNAVVNEPSTSENIGIKDKEDQNKCKIIDNIEELANGEGNETEEKTNETEEKTNETEENTNETEQKEDCGDISKTQLRLRKKQSNKLEKNSIDKSTNEERDETTVTEDNNQNTRNKRKKEINNDTIHFHFTLFLLWFITAALNIPSVLTWARNFQYSRKLRPDPSNIPGAVLCICAIFLWQMEVPKKNKLFYKEIGFFIYTMAIGCLVYAPVSIYRLPYILTATITVVTLHQLFAPEQIPDNDEQIRNDSLEEKDPVEHISDIKTKLE